MKTDPSAPADTRMMGIVHAALRRDIARALALLPSSPAEAQRVALGRHVEWMMAFLHSHHHGEDIGLWPLVRSRDPRTAALLDTMEADHQAIAPLVEECTARAGDYAASDADPARAALLDALQRLAATLLPHLQREEDEAMPAVAVAITAAEWKAVDKEHYLDGKSLAQLGFEGHWLLDGLDAERAGVVVHQVSAVARFVLVHGFARRYRRHATACWGDADANAYGPAPKLPRRIPGEGRAEAVVDASPAEVWRVVSDVTRVPDWSGECREVDWIDGATEAVPGARFRGANRAGPWSWARTNEVVAADAPHRFVWRTVPTLGYPDSSEWSIELEPAVNGTRIVQTYRVVRGPKVLGFLYSVLVPSHRDRSRELTEDLRRLGQVAARTTAAAR